MAEQIPGAKQLINDRGGYRAVADALGWPITTVHTFFRADQAPKYRWDTMAALPPLGATKKTKRRRSPAEQRAA